MSHIPSSAMPRAAPAEVLEREETKASTPEPTPTPQLGPSDQVDLPSRSAFSWLGDNKALAIGAGLALTGAIAAAAYPRLRGKDESSSRGKKRKKK